MSYSPNVLVVDDEKGMWDTVAAIFEEEEEGHRVVAGHNGAKALKHIREAHVDHVISDLRLPDMTGLEISRVLILKEERLK